MDEKTGFETRTILAVPMHTHDRTIGVLEVINKREGGFDESDLKLGDRAREPGGDRDRQRAPLRPPRGRGRHLADVVPPLGVGDPGSPTGLLRPGPRAIGASARSASVGLEPLRRVGREDVRLRVDLAHEAGEHAARPELEELGAAGLDERADAVHPPHRARDLGRQRVAELLARGDDPSIGVDGDGDERVDQGISAIASAIRACTGCMSAPWKAAPAAIETTRSAPARSASSASCATAPRSPETTIWPGALMLASAIAPATVVVDLQSSSSSCSESPMTAHHRTRVLRLDVRHQPAAQADELHAGLDRDRSGGDRGRVLAEAVAGDEVGAQSARAGRVRQRQGDREQRRLGHLRARELHHRAFQAEAADREPRDGLGLGEVVLEVRLGAKQFGAHADLLRPLSRIDERQAHTRSLP